MDKEADAQGESSTASSISRSPIKINSNALGGRLLKDDCKDGSDVGGKNDKRLLFTRSVSQQNESNASQESSSSVYLSLADSSSRTASTDISEPLSESGTLSQKQTNTPNRKIRSASLSQTNTNKKNNNNQSNSLSCIDLSQYTPVEYHWFHCGAKEVDKQWLPFSFLDSKRLEEAYANLQKDILQTEMESDEILEGNTNFSKKLQMKYIIPTDGGRFDVDLTKFKRNAVYWRDAESRVRRCSWFYKKDGYSRYEPYDEDMCVRLEKYYKACAISNDWNKRYDLSATELLVINGPTHFIHYDQCCKEEWLSMAENPYSPRQIHRGANEIFNIDIGEQSQDQIDHLIFFIHGVGGVCDVRFRSCVEVVNDFRKIANGLLASSSGATITNDGTSVTKRSSSSKLTSTRTSTGQVRRIEFLPISWHSCTRREIGINERLNQIALNSVPKLRQFLNKVIVDALLYASGPIYCQTIMDNVGNEVNRLYTLFCKRHPSFNGSVSLAGHSLGSLIVFDLLANQISDLKTGVETPSKYKDFGTISELFRDLELSEYLGLFEREKIDINTLIMLSDSDLKEMKLPLGVRRKLSTYINFKKMSLIPQPQNSNNSETTPNNSSKLSSMGHIESMNTGQWMINYPQLKFKPRCFFAFGSPMPMFLTVRGMENINSEYKLPTCSKMLNIFHPYDPLAYRIEPLIDTRFAHIKPVLIPHHRGGKRMHLQLRDGFAKVGSDIKHKIIDSLKSTWSNLTRFNSSPSNVASGIPGVQPKSRNNSTTINEEEMVDMSTSTSNDSFRQNTQSETDGSFFNDLTGSVSVSSRNSKDSSHMTQDNASIKRINSKKKMVRKSQSDIGITRSSPNNAASSNDNFANEDEDAAFEELDPSGDAYCEKSENDIPTKVGNLNEGRRIDYVLQEKPIEYMFNEYVFAFTSHASYWQNEDSAMMMLNEIYQADDMQMFDYFDEANKAATNN